MARLSNRLTVRQVATATPASKPQFLADGDGLYLRVDPSGGKSWVLRYRFAGKRHDLGLGSFKLVTLAEARQRSIERRKLVHIEGINPKEQGVQARRRAAVIERATTNTKTFAEVAEAYIASHETNWNRREGPQWRASLRDHAKLIANLPVQAIGKQEVLRVLEPIWTKVPETATRVRYRIEMVLAYAMGKGYRPDGENPARWEGFLKSILPPKAKIAKSKSHAKIEIAKEGPDAVAAFMAKLRGVDGAPARALEFTILTAARVSEVVGATWGEIDLERRLWTIPAARMKADGEHRVPLSDAAVALLSALPSDRDPQVRVFRFRAPQTVLNALKRLRPDITVHGFRGTFADWGHDHERFQHETVEQCLAHKIGDATMRSYYTSDALEKRRRVMEAWADFCAGTENDAEVVPLRA